MVADVPGLGERLLEGSDFHSHVIEIRGGSELLRELVALCVVEIVPVLLPGGQAAQQRSQAARLLDPPQVFVPPNHDGNQPWVFWARSVWPEPSEVNLSSLCCRALRDS